MEKQIRNFEVNYSLNWEYGVEISKLKQDLEELEKLGATHVEITPYLDYDCPFVKIEPYAQRIETDDEFNCRIVIQKRREDEQKRRDLEQIEKLKSKYGL